MSSFQSIYDRAARRKGGPEVLEDMLPSLPGNDLNVIPDDRWLSRAAKGVMAAGFAWKVVENMWPKHEEVLFGFELEPVAFLQAADIDRIADMDGIIGHRPKLAAIRDNARMMLDVVADHGSFGEFVASWPADDVVGLWAYLKAHGARLGGMTGPYFLRSMGVDTPLMTRDVVAALVAAKVIDGQPTSKKRMRAVQETFSRWRQETGRSYTELSRILAYSIDG